LRNALEGRDDCIEFGIVAHVFHQMAGMHYRGAVPCKARGHIPHGQPESRVRDIHADLPDPRDLPPATQGRPQFGAGNPEHGHKQIDQCVAQRHIPPLPQPVGAALLHCEAQVPTMPCCQQLQCFESFRPRVNDIR